MNKSARIVAWMLTPVVVWAGAFTSGWVGARVGERLSWLIVGSVVGGLVGIVGWSYLLLYLKRRSASKTRAAGAEET